MDPQIKCIQILASIRTYLGKYVPSSNCNAWLNSLDIHFATSKLTRQTIETPFRTNMVTKSRHNMVPKTLDRLLTDG